MKTGLIETVLCLFRFDPKVNLTHEGYLLRQIVQANGEIFDEFLTRIQTQSLKCNFVDLTDSLVVIVIGTLSNKLRETLLCEDDLKLDKAIATWCKASEMSSKQIQELQKKDSEKFIHQVIGELDLLSE